MKPMILQPGFAPVASPVAHAAEYARGMAASARAVVAHHVPSLDVWQGSLGGYAAGVQNKVTGYRELAFSASLRFAKVLPLSLISGVALGRGLDVGDGDGNLLGELIYNTAAFPGNHPYVTAGTIGGVALLVGGSVTVFTLKKAWNWLRREEVPTPESMPALEEQLNQGIQDQPAAARESVAVESNSTILPSDLGKFDNSVHGTFADSEIISGDTQVVEDVASILANPDGQGVESDRKDSSFQYEVIEQIAVGGMGTVVLIRKIGDTTIRKGSGPIVIRDGTLLALKEIKPELAADDEFLLDFMREALANDKYNHPNIVQQVKIFGNPLRVAHEYLEKDNLRQLMNHKIQSDEKIELREGIQIFIDCIKALVEIYRYGDVHRDLKPENILLTEVDGQLVAKVGDFGLVQSSTAIQAYRSKGTLTFMSPEQTRSNKNGPKPNHRSDMFALALIVYELLTGEHALVDFDAVNDIPEDFRNDITDKDKRSKAIAMEKQRRILDYIRSATPINPHRKRKAIPPELAEILLKCLKKNPDDRYQDPKVLLRDVEEVMQDLPQGAISESDEVDGDVTQLMRRGSPPVRDTLVLDEEG